MTPKLLRYLRLNDAPPTEWDDLTVKLPVEVIDLGLWFEFCQRLTQGSLWEYELLTIDFNFINDTSGPWFPLPDQDAKTYNADFLKDPNLSLLCWPQSLVDARIGPNSGLLIGVHLVAHASQRDLPCGVAFHTYHSDIVLRDIPSAMLATQILIASGVNIQTRALDETMSQTVGLIRESFKQPVLGLGVAAARFRQAFLRRAGAGGPQDEGMIRLWVEPASLWTLLDIFRESQTEEELDARLSKVGVEFYDRNGALHSLDLRSIFLDRLIYRTKENVTNVRPRIPLADAQPAGGERTQAGPLWQFVETLAARIPSNIAPVLAFFRDTGGDEEVRSINEALKRKIHRLIALIFAWLDLSATRWFEERSRPYDPFRHDFNGDFPTLLVQIGELLKIYARTREAGWVTEDGDNFGPEVHFLDLADKEGPTISAAVREHSRIPDAPLHKPLRYDRPNSEKLSQKRRKALERLLNIAARWRCVEKEFDEEGKATGRYRLKTVVVPEQRPSHPSHADLAERLGFNVKHGQDPSKQLGRIIQDTPGYENESVKEFLGRLEERPLPDHLKWLGWEFMDEFWGPKSDLPLPDEAWPVCLAEARRQSGETLSLVEWKRKMQRSNEAARDVQKVIMPPSLSFAAARCSIWGQRDSAEEVGGDYYRVRQGPQGEYHIYIGDVCGSGLPAALLVQELHGLITILEERELPPEQLCAQLDSKLYERTFGYSQQEDAGQWARSNQWATLVCCVLDVESKRLTYANAGHPPPILARKDGSAFKLEHEPELRSCAVGMFPGSSYRSSTVKLAPGDRVVFFTDGISEVLEGDLLTCILDNRQLGAKELGELLLRRMTQSNALDDDRTLIVLSVD